MTEECWNDWIQRWVSRMYVRRLPDVNQKLRTRTYQLCTYNLTSDSRYKLDVRANISSGWTSGSRNITVKEMSSSKSLPNLDLIIPYCSIDWKVTEKFAWGKTWSTQVMRCKSSGHHKTFGKVIPTDWYIKSDCTESAKRGALELVKQLHKVARFVGMQEWFNTCRPPESCTY